MTMPDDASARTPSPQDNTEPKSVGPTEVEALLPWYAVGTLDGRDRRRVEEALRSDPALARQADLVHEELAETIALNETLGAPSSRAMARLMATIDAETGAPRKRSLARTAADRLTDFIASLSPRTLAVAASLATLVVALQASMLLGLFTKPPGAHGTFAMVHFVREASAAEITNFLEINHVTLVDGPMAGGFYRVQLSTEALTAEQLNGIASRMHQAPIVDEVRFTAPALER